MPLRCDFQLVPTLFRTKEAVRNGTFQDFNINESYFLRCLYPEDAGDPDNVEHNFLRSRWLLLVSFLCIFILFYSLLMVLQDFSRYFHLSVH